MALELSNNTLKGVFSDGVTRRISFPHADTAAGAIRTSAGQGSFLQSFCILAITHGKDLSCNPFAFPPLHTDVQVPRSTWMCESGHPWRSDVQVPRTSPGMDEVGRSRMPEPSTWQGLLLQSSCIPAIAHGCAGAAKHMDVRERPSMTVRCATAAAPCRARPGTVSLRWAINSQTLSRQPRRPAP